MTKKVSDARSDDCGSLRQAILGYVTAHLKAPIFPMIPSNSKTGIRGFNHPIFARLLCPIELLEDFNSNPTTCVLYHTPAKAYISNSYMQKLRDGIIPVTADSFPAFLYEDPGAYDPDDMDHGLCRGYLLVCVSSDLLLMVC
jgi:hypothetical protein